MMEPLSETTGSAGSGSDKRQASKPEIDHSSGGGSGGSSSSNRGHGRLTEPSQRLSRLLVPPVRNNLIRLERQEGPGRRVHYTSHSYATDRPEGERYRAGS